MTTMIATNQDHKTLYFELENDKKFFHAKENSSSKNSKINLTDIKEFSRRSQQILS